MKSNDLETILNRIVQKEDLGPSPITAKSLTSNICDYTGVLYRILKKYEALNVSSASISSEPTVDDLAENVSPWWAYGQLKDLNDFTSLGKRQRQKVSRQLRSQINNPVGPTPTFTIPLPEELRAVLSTLVVDTRKRIANSTRLKSGDNQVSLNDCFAPQKSSQNAPHRLFQLLPMRSFRMPFITLEINTLVSLYNNSITRTNDTDWAGVSRKQGIHRIREDSQTFGRVFNLSKVRLGRR